MNKNISPLILIILAIGTYFTFTRAQVEELKAIQSVNTQYKEAINNSASLLKIRDEVKDKYDSLSEDDKIRLEKMVPDNMDNVRLIIDINGIAVRHGLALKNIKSSSANESAKTNQDQSGSNTNASLPYNTAVLSFETSGSYQKFTDFMKDIEASLRIIEVSKLSLSAGESGSYDYSVEIRTFWLK